MIHRTLEQQIQSVLGNGKAIILYGARQTGKTTLLKKIAEESNKKYLYFDAEILRDRTLFESHDLERIKFAIGNAECVIIDEAQKIQGIGSILKTLHDHIPQIQWIASGSSSFDLAQKTQESLAGRTNEFFLTPLMSSELTEAIGAYQLEGKLDTLLRFGLYPGIFGTSEQEAKDALRTLSGQIISKDILEIEGIRKSPVITRLLELLALQIGQNISFTELGTQLGLSTHTVQKYIFLLEEAFIIFSLRGFAKNLRNEVTRSPKIYFYDLGIRNALLDDFKPIHLRSDIGMLWENFIIAERVKFARSIAHHKRSFFWRTADQKEVDYIEEYDGDIHAYEIKWNKERSRHFTAFQKAYPESICKVISKDNWLTMMQ